MTGTTREQTALLAAEWAAEVAPRFAQIQPDPRGSPLQRFAHGLAGDDPMDGLTILFYVTVDEARQDLLARPAAPTELVGEATVELSRWLKGLMYHAQLVAAPFEAQRSEIPEDFVSLADEVSLTFEDWLRPFRSGGPLHGLLMERQLAALVGIDDWLASFSGPENEALWSDHALREAPQWARARQLAAEGVRALGLELQ